MSRQEVLRSLREDIINTYIFDGLLPIEVYEKFVGEVDLSLFDNNKALFYEFVDGVVYSALYATMLIQS